MNDRLHQRSGFTLVELLVVISIIAIIAGLVVPALLQGRGEAWKIQCTNNLKQIYPAAAAYADKKFEFPRDKSVAEPLAHDSLNILLRSLQGRNLEPKLFKCPAGEASIAVTDKDEKLQLDEDTLDYSWAIVRRKLTENPVPLAACAHHEGILIVLFTDSSIEFWELDDPEVDDKIDGGTGLPRGLGR